MNSLDAQTIYGRRPNAVLWLDRGGSYRIDEVTLYRRIIPFMTWHREPVIFYANPRGTRDFCLARYAVLLALGSKHVHIMCKDREQLETYVAQVNDALCNMLGERVSVMMPGSTAGFHWNDGCSIDIGPVQRESYADLLVFPHDSPEAMEVIVYGNGCKQLKQPCIVAVADDIKLPLLQRACDLPSSPYFSWTGPTAAEYRAQIAEQNRVVTRFQAAAVKVYVEWRDVLLWTALTFLGLAAMIFFMWLDAHVFTRA